MSHSQNTMDTLHGPDGGEADRRKLVAAAAERNQASILDVIMPHLHRQRVERAGGRVDVLEVASGTGQHAFAIARALSEQPSEQGFVNALFVISKFSAQWPHQRWLHRSTTGPVG